MGARPAMVQNLWVYMVDPKFNVIFVKGSVPGKDGKFVRVRDAFYKKFTSPPPHPTFYPPKDEDLTKVEWEHTVIRAESKKLPVLEEIQKLHEELKKEKSKAKKGPEKGKKEKK